MSSEEEEHLVKLDPKVEKRIAFVIGLLYSSFLFFCMIDLKANLGYGDSIIALTFGESILKSTAQPLKLKTLPSLPSSDDKFEDLQAILDGKINENSYKNFNEVIMKYPERKENPMTMKELVGKDEWEDYRNLDKFQMKINQYEMYAENSTEVEEALRELVTLPIKYVYEKSGGTQFKMIITFQNGEKAHCKPWRMARDEQANPNHFYFNDFERHNAEIAAYHVDKSLGFRRSVPHIGRIVNMTSEIFPNADDDLYSTFYISPDNNVCMHGHCDYYCSTYHGICGNPDTIEISIGLHLPKKEDKTERKVWRNPWRRSYSKRRRVPYHFDRNYCEIIKKIPPYDGPRLLDLIDLHIFDFFIGNQDRHHYETFKIFGNETFIISLDHGRTFGLPYFDDIEILTPIETCCIIKESTLKMLLSYHNGEKKLSDAVRESMASDPIAPILWEPHLQALDRRLSIVLQAVRNCLRRKDFEARNAKQNGPTEA